MFRSQSINIKEGVTGYSFLHKDHPVSYSDWIDLLKPDALFRRFFSELLRTSPYKAYYFEVKPVSSATLNQKFEFVLVESKVLLDKKANRSAFASYFTSGKNVVSFLNLRKVK